MEQNKPRAIIYGRVSQTDQTTTSTQVKEVSDKIKDTRVIIDTIEEKKSAKDKDNIFDTETYMRLRPKFYSIYIRAKTHKDFNELWVWKMDRFARSDFQEIIIRMFKKEGVEVKALIGSDTPLGRRVESAVSIEYIEDLKKRVKLKQRELVEEEKKWITRPCFGYKVIKKYNPETGKVITSKMVIDEAKAKTVKHIFLLYCKGMKRMDIARKFNMNPQSVTNLLQNRQYLGEMSYEGEPYLADFESIFKTPEEIKLFEKASAKVISQREDYKKRNPNLYRTPTGTKIGN